MPEKLGAEDTHPDPLPPWAIRHTREEAAWITLDYEWKMYKAMREICETPAAWRALGGAVVNALVESWCLHARNLCNFLACPISYETMLVMGDLVGYPAPHEIGLLQDAFTAAIGNGEEGSPGWLFWVMSDPTIYRQASHDSGPELETIHAPLAALVEAIYAWREKKQLEEKRRRLAEAEGESLSSVLRDQLTESIYRDGEEPPAKEEADARGSE